MNNHKVKCSNFEIANNKPFTLIAGPCQLESEEHAIKISNELKKITSELGINLIYKTSFDKANRTSLKGKRGIIFGALNSQSIAWKVAEKCHEQGAEFLLTNAPIALRMGKINELAEKCSTKVVPADLTLSLIHI